MFKQVNQLFVRFYQFINTWFYSGVLKRLSAHRSEIKLLEEKSLKTKAGSSSRQKRPQPQLCPVWSAEFHALQTEHTNLTAEAENLLQETLSQPLSAKEKSEALEPIAKKLESLAEKLESAYQKTLDTILFHDVSPEQRELIETDLLPQYRHWLKQSHKNPEPINPTVQPKFCGYDLLQYDEATDHYFYEGGKTRTILKPDGKVHEELSDTPETIAVYEKFANRKFIAPTEAEFIARIKPGLAQIQAMKVAHSVDGKLGKVKVVFSCIANSVRANAEIFDRERTELKFPGHAQQIDEVDVEDVPFSGSQVNEGTAKYYGELDFDESPSSRAFTMQPETGMSLEQLIEKTNGFLLTVTPDVEELPEDPEVIYDLGDSALNFIILKRSWDKLKKAKQRALSPHEELAFLQTQVAEGKVCDYSTCIALLGVNKKFENVYATSMWFKKKSKNSIYLGWDVNRCPNLRLRGSAIVF